MVRCPPATSTGIAGCLASDEAIGNINSGHDQFEDHQPAQPARRGRPDLDCLSRLYKLIPSRVTVEPNTQTLDPGPWTPDLQPELNPTPRPFTLLTKFHTLNQQWGCWLSLWWNRPLTSAPQRATLNPKPRTQNPTPYALYLHLYLNHKPYTHNLSR